jgi:hypothetical protein
MRAPQRKSSRSIVRAVLLSFLCVLVPATVFGGQAPGAQTTGAPTQGHTETPEGPTYDPNTEGTFTGTVTAIRAGGPGRLGWLMRAHTLGFGHRAADDAQLLLKTDNDTVRIRLGPTAFLSDRKVEITEGDRLAVTGSSVTVGDSQVVLAREIRKGDTAWTLRNAAGQALWSTTQPERRRFWTTTKVVLVVVAAKVALLATVLRH